MLSPGLSPVEQSASRYGRLQRTLRKLSRTAAAAEVTLPVVEPRQEYIDHTPLIAKTAAQVGITLTPERIAHLAKMVSNDPRVARGSYVDSGVFISPPFADETGRTSSEIHFLPTTKKTEWAKDAQPQEATSVAHAGLEAMQNYVLLAEAGILSPADELEGYGHTNAAMARAANRLGFSGTNGEIKVPFETLRERVLSPEMIALKDTFGHRLATMEQTPVIPQHIPAS